jgi:ABC-type phosphate transport system substrate-binding protein
MDFDRLVGIFRGEEALWDNKKSIIIVLPSSKNETAEEIAKTIFNGSVMTMKKYWLGLVFQGRANPPVFLDSNEDIINYVQKNQGAIGILYCKKEIVPQSLLINIAE